METVLSEHLPNDPFGQGITGTGSVHIPAPSSAQGKWLSLGGIRVWYPGPAGGSGTLQVSVGGKVILKKDVEDAFHWAWFAGHQAGLGESILVTCPGAEIWVSASQHRLG